jgi:hypothetical protein
MVIKWQDVCVTALQAWVWSMFLMKRTLIESTKPVPVYSMLFQPLRTCLFLALMCQMPSPWPHLQNRGSSSDRTKPSLNGGRTQTAPPYQMDMSSLCFQQCRDIPNPHTSGKSTLTPYSVILGLPQQCMNHAFTPESSMVSACSLCDRLMTLQLPRLMLELPIYYWT